MEKSIKNLKNLKIMSTRKILKDRRSWFKNILKKDPTNESAIKVVKEIDFIMDKLKNYDLG